MHRGGVRSGAGNRRHRDRREGWQDHRRDGSQDDSRQNDWQDGRQGDRQDHRRGGRRGSRHPSGLSGRDIGLWYAHRGKARKKARELQERAVVTMDRQREERISELLQEMKTPTEQHSDPRGAAGPSWRDADRLDDKLHTRPIAESVLDVQDTEGKAMGHMFDDVVCEETDMADETTPEIHQQSQGSQATCSHSRAVSYPSHPLQPDSALDLRLKEELADKKLSNAKYIAMQDFRMKLPSYQMKEKLLKLISSNQAVVISGETGCGKTTQVAQFILDSAIASGAGSLCRIICTQPRRISAISVAERVAAERGEACGQNNSVGYQIRLDKKLPRKKGSILYCTTGVLLRWLISDPLLQCASHIILDEIHERDLMSDFLLIIIRDMLPLRPDLKLILMSATLNAEMFSAYYRNCPMAHIPGFTFPVEEIYLEKVIEMTRYSVEPKQQRSPRAEPKWKKFTRRREAKKKRLEKSGMWPQQGDMDDGLYEREEDEWQRYLDSIRPRFPSQTMTTLENMDFEKVDLELVVKVITHICLNMKEGAILCFLPGWDDISKLNDKLTSSRVFSSEKFRIIPLHSMLPTSNQREVFDRPPRGVRKIVIATNIAETSITIDDVVFVVDCGKTKEQTYDAGNKISCLRPVWISKASSKQRRGRAGRVQPGFCFHLFTEFHAQSLIDYQLPEMLRTPLEELCLQIKILKLGKISTFVSKALQPPSEQAVHNALEVLTQLNALDDREELTPLGYHLATLPVDPRVGKMILFGAIFSCLDPVLTVASMLGFKDPFVLPLHKQKEADRVKRRFAGDTCSDHIAFLNAYKGWEASGQQNSYSWDNFLSSNTLKMIESMRKQFVRLLCDIGFLNNADPKASDANLNSENMRLVKAVLCAGLYPNVVKIEHHAGLKRPPVLRTPQDGRVFLHPKSVNLDTIVFEDNWLIYHMKIKSSKVFIHDSTMIAPYPLLFFGGKISVFQEDGHDMISVDDVIKFRSPTRIATLVKELCQQLDKLLKQKIAQPDMKLTLGCGADDKGAALIRAIIELITSQDTTSRRKRKSMEGDGRS